MDRTKHITDFDVWSEGEGEGRCPVFGKCGGCSMLDIAYTEQLTDKDKQIAEIFDGICDPSIIKPIIGMDDPYHYRDKIIAPFIPGKKSEAKTKHLRDNKRGNKQDFKKSKAANKVSIKSGMYERGTHNVIEPPRGGCILENAYAIKVINAIKALMIKGGIAPYNEDTHSGFMRHAIIRAGHTSNELLVTLVTNSEEFPHSKWFCRELVRRVPEITSIVQSTNTRQTNVVIGDRERTLYGPGFILDRICGLSFRISASSFYQVNSTQTEVLYKTAMKLAGPLEDVRILDAYCGTGTIGLVAAAQGAASLIGIDNVASSIKDARQNAKHNGIECAEFVCADATEWLCTTNVEGFDVAFIDPPRAGSTPEFLHALADIAPKRIVYISCNPTTQARDIKVLQERGYSLEALQPIDMFPHTPHVETIIQLFLNEQRNV